MSNDLCGGISIGIQNETTGTIGYIFRDPMSREFLILTAGHVLNNWGGARSTYVCQPGDIDCRALSLTPTQYLVGDVVRVDPQTLSFSSSNPPLYKVDAGVARLRNPNTLQLKIMECGAVKEIGTAQEEMIVRKVGRTTGLTFGKVTDIRSSYIITNPANSNEIAILSDQILTTSMSKEGDSGSVLLDEWNRVIGLLCAGGDDKSVFTPIHEVMNALNITLF